MRTVRAQHLGLSRCRIDSGLIPAVAPQLLVVEGVLLICWPGFGGRWRP